MKEINYKEKGITLVALVLTIIILLILAGVTISTALRTKWIISKSKICRRRIQKLGRKGTIGIRRYF